MSPWANVTINSNVGEVARWLDQISYVLSPRNVTEFLAVDFQTYLKDRAASNFRRQVDPGGNPWAPLQERTERMRVSQGYPPGPINDRSGEMKRFITQNPSTKIAAGVGNAVMTWPGNPADDEMRQKLTTAAKGKTKPKTVARPVVGIAARDAVASIEMLTFWFINECERLQGPGLGGMTSLAAFVA